MCLLALSCSLDGQSPMAHVTGLALNSVYRFRVVAVNALDIRSNPSPITQVRPPTHPPPTHCPPERHVDTCLDTYRSVRVCR